MKRFLLNMDEKTWYRMLVCFLPGLVASKLAAFAEPDGAAPLISTLLMVGGVTLYLSWDRVRRHFVGGDAAAEEVEGTSSAAAAADVLTELRALAAVARNDATTVVDMLAIELRVDTSATIHEAVRRALLRHR
jgi:hypothetical protein